MPPALIVRSTKEAAELRTRLDDTTTQLESARNALETGGTNIGGESTSKGDGDEDAADLESEASYYEDRIHLSVVP